MNDEDNIVAPPVVQVEDQSQDQKPESESEIEVVEEGSPESGPDEAYDVDGDEVKVVEAAEVDKVDEAVEEEAPEAEEKVEKVKLKKKKKHSSLKTEFNNVQREKYRALQELEEVKKDNLRLQQLASQSAEAATSHYDNAIDLKIQQGKALKTQAYENADTESILQADEILTKAYNEKSVNDRWKNEQTYLKSQEDAHREAAISQQANPQQYQEAPMELNDETKGWLESNTWFDPRSNEYDAEMAADVQDYSAILERKYIKLGKEESVFSNEYYNDINKFIDDNYGEGEDSTPPPAATNNRSQPRMNLNMKQVRQNVAPVSQSKASAGTPHNPNRVVLSAKERDFARSMGVKPEVYAKHKLEIQKSNRYGYESYKR